MTISLAKAQIISSFNHAAPTYNTALAVPKLIGLRLLERLQYIRLQPEIILNLGCATNYLSTELQPVYPNATIYGVDFALQLLLAGKYPHNVCADAYYLPFADQSVDLIFSNLMLAWCFDLDALFAELKRVLKPQGLLLFTSLGPDTLQELKLSWQQIDALHSHVHPFLDMHHIGDSLLRTQFIDPVVDMEKLTIYYAQINTLFNDLKSLGMHNVTSDRQRGLCTKNQLEKLTQMYEQYRTSTQQLPATVEVIYGHAWAPAGNEFALNSAGEAFIPVSKIKRKHT